MMVPRRLAVPAAGGDGPFTNDALMVNNKGGYAALCHLCVV